MANQKMYEGFVIGVYRYYEDDKVRVIVQLDCDCGRSSEIQIIFDEDELFECRSLISYLNPIRITLYRGHRRWKVKSVEEIIPTNKMLGDGA
jgi:hypothetical protein